MIKKNLGIIIAVLVVIGVAAAGAILLDYKQVIPPTPTKPELTLANYPKLFEKDVVIVIGENATQIEMEGAQAIAENLRNLTGNVPAIKTDAEITENEKANYNLILVGRPDANGLLRDVYERTNTTKVTKEYPGAGKGVLEILKNPWGKDKAMLLVEGSDEEGLVAGLNEIHWLPLSKKKFGESRGDVVTIVGSLQMPMASWSPSFDECISPSYFIETGSREIYYLENICPYLYLSSKENLTNESKEVIVTTERPQFTANIRVEIRGKFEKREVVVPIRKEPNAPTKKEIFNVIVVSDLKVLNIK